MLLVTNPVAAYCARGLLVLLVDKNATPFNLVRNDARVNGVKRDDPPRIASLPESTFEDKYLALIP